MSEKTNFVKTMRDDMQVKQQIFHNLLEISELYPEYPIVQHFAAILRRKSEVGLDFFHWDNKTLLKRIEQHKSELESEDIMNEIGDE